MGNTSSAHICHLLNNTPYNITLYDYTVHKGSLRFVNQNVISFDVGMPLPIFELEEDEEEDNYNESLKSSWFCGSFRFTMEPATGEGNSYGFEVFCQPHKKDASKSIFKLIPRYENESSMDFPFIFVEPEFIDDVCVVQIMGIVDVTAGPAPIDPSLHERPKAENDDYVTTAAMERDVEAVQQIKKTFNIKPLPSILRSATSPRRCVDSFDLSDPSIKHRADKIIELTQK
ncbi:hypothetical protein AKO1_013375 [Acrasis kona]|uniref:Uncharacterized protein n=1 Tax=Acrasis kona TaxID=1008807 RepID=A0AAW2YZW3_9EUKA